MIGIGIRKFARERGLICRSGYAYGRLNGRYILLDEGLGFKQLQVYLYPALTENENREAWDAAAMAVLTGCDLAEYRLEMEGAVRIERGFARLMFHDTMGTMQRIIRYIDEILPGLDALHLPGDHCPCCGMEMDGDAAFVHLGDVVLSLHEKCIPMLENAMDREEDQQSGSFAKGLIGAFLGALAGAVLYALLFSFGRIAALMGLATGRIVSELYDRFGGRKTRWKLLVVAVMLVLAVTVGQAAGYCVMFSQLYDEIGYSNDEISRMGYVQECWEMYLIHDQKTALGLQYDRRMADVPEAMRISREDHIRMNYMRDVDETREEMQHEFIVNYRMGLFAGLVGGMAIFIEEYRKNQKTRVRRLR